MTLLFGYITDKRENFIYDISEILMITLELFYGFVYQVLSTPLYDRFQRNIMELIKVYNVISLRELFVFIYASFLFLRIGYASYFIFFKCI